MAEKKDLRVRIREGMVVADGAMGTQLAKLALPPGTAPSSLNLTHARDVEAIHRSYVEAGAEIVLTNTFGGSKLRLAGFHLEEKLHDINLQGAQIARRGAQEKAFVLGNVGPTGKDHLLPPYGTEAPETFLRGFSEQVRALVEGGVDGIFVETMMSLGEALLAVEAARKVCELPLFCSLAFKKPPRDKPEDFRSFWGDDVKTIARQLADAGVEVLGANCGELVEEMPLLASRMREETELPLVFEVNAGYPRLDVDYSTVYELEPAAFAALGREIVNAGANVVGGCCGTTPQHIRALRAALESS